MEIDKFQNNFPLSISRRIIIISMPCVKHLVVWFPALIAFTKPFMFLREQYAYFLNIKVLQTLLTNNMFLQNHVCLLVSRLTLSYPSIQFVNLQLIWGLKYRFRRLLSHSLQRWNSTQVGFRLGLFSRTSHEFKSNSFRYCCLKKIEPNLSIDVPSGYRCNTVCCRTKKHWIALRI